ncbi:MAG: response regulator transcription factor [Pseudomonadota bacterium]
MKTALIIDDHPMIHIGCSEMLREMGFAEVLKASSMEKGLAEAGEHQPCLTVLDIGLPDANGLDAIAPLRTAAPGLKVLVFSMNDRPVFAERVLETGADGFLSKNAAPARFREAVRTVLKGNIYLEHELAIKLVARRKERATDPLSVLSPREREVLFCLGDGLELAAIANRLKVSYKTAANTSSSLKRKLGARGLNDLIRIAIENRPQ